MTSDKEMFTLDNSMPVLNFADGSQFSSTPNTALIFIDETGDENITDPNHGVFGFGGCCVLAKNYKNDIVQPWLKLKKDYFGMIEKPLHAADTRFNNNQINALNKFFSTYKFGRFAVLVSKKSVIDLPFNPLSATFTDFHLRLIDILKWTPFEKIVIIFEDSERLKPQLEKVASTLKLRFNEKLSNSENEIDIEYCVMNKQSACPGLEVADFIVHSSGTTVRDMNNGKISKLLDRKDFYNIFANIDKQYISFISIDSVKSTKE